MDKAPANSKSAAVIGAGPAGLMAAEVISQAGIRVDVYDAMPSAGRKFLMAGKGGLNITHSEARPQFLARYGAASPQFTACLNEFGPERLIAWVHGLGIKTFTGSSGRVFPEGMKAAPLLRAWLHRLRHNGVAFHMRHRWLGWREGDMKQLVFETPEGRKTINAGAIVLALGGASWPQLGSTGEWAATLARRGIRISPLLPANCGFDANWSELFLSRFAGQPLKSVNAKFGDLSRQGDCMITGYGIEGSPVYFFSSALRDRINSFGSAILTLDLVPHVPLPVLMEQASKRREGQSLSNHLRKRLRLDKVKQGLLRETLTKEEILDPERLCATIKALPLTLTAARPVAEAISTAGGLFFDEMDNNLMMKSIPGLFCAGEMLDWDAPTGGYLLTGCFASGRTAGKGAVKWLDSKN